MTAQYPSIPKSEGVITENYKYLRYIESKPMFEELYHLKTDRYEKHNLAMDPNHQGILDEMRKKCNSLLEAVK